MKLLRTAVVAVAAWFALSLLVVFARRLAYPFDIEWMEGGMLTHALRFAEGQPIYAPPSVDFVPFLYTPFYPALVATLGKIFGIGYKLGRTISLLGFFAAWIAGYVFVKREGQSRAAALGAMAIPLAAFVPTGAWYDLARPDSLYLGLVTVALILGWWKRNSHRGVVAAALLMVLGFFTKQTASPFMVAFGFVFLVSNWRTALTFGATLAVTGLPTLWLLNSQSDGWFWTYVFKLHQAHDFYPLRAFLGTPLVLILLVGPALVVVPWALLRVRSPSLAYATWLAIFGVAASCLGFGTQWAFTNAFIPGVFFSAIAIGVAAGRLISGQPQVTLIRTAERSNVVHDSAPPRLRPHVVYLLLLGSLALAPGGLLKQLRHAPPKWGVDPTWPAGYDPRPYLPTNTDEKAGNDLLARLRDTPGEVLIPFHPFYAHLAGKRTFLHRMGVLDVTRAGLGTPQGLSEALAKRRFSLVVMDDKIDGNWHMWPGLLEHYRQLDPIIPGGPRVFSGAQTTPRYLLLPKIETPPPAPPVPDEEREP